MSSIDKMSIQGIRSFGPDDASKGVIQFFTPLTLILGPNGTGKTTIIECLKYITTGEMPSGAGKAFVHDPKVAGETEVKSKVKLLFKDLKGESCLVDRSMEAKQTRQNVTVKSLSSVITRWLSDGQKHSVDKRCADMDREMVNLLGVSKSVLENVIFCHQEDSTWPLSDGKTLKTKFDDIFASSRYVKALESIVKFRKEQNIKVGLYKNEIKHLKQNRDKAVEFQQDLRDKEARYKAAEDEMSHIEHQLAPIQDKIQTIDHRVGDIYKMQTDIEKLKSERKEMEKTVSEIRDQIQHTFDGSTDELREKLSKFEDELRNKALVLEQITEKLRGVDSRLEELTESKSNLLLQQGKLEQEAQSHKENVRKRDRLVQQTAEQLAITGYSGRLDDRAVEQFLSLLDKQAEKQLKQAKQARAEYEDKESALEKQIDKKKKDRTELETKQQMRRDGVRKNRDEIRRINQQLSDVTVSGDKLKHVERDLKRTEAELAQVESSVNVDVLKREIEALKQEKIALDTELKQLDALMSRMSRESSIRSELDIFRKQKTDKEDNVRKLKAKTEDALLQILAAVPSDNFGLQVSRKMAEQSRELRHLTGKLDKLRTQMASQDTERKNFREQLRRKEEELREHEERINNVCDTGDVEQGLSQAQRHLQEATDNKGYLLGTKRVFDRYVEKLGRASDPPCPLCLRPFDNHDEIRELIAELENKLSLLPVKLDEAEEKISSKTQLYENVLHLQPVKVQADALRQTEIPRLKQQLQDVSESIEKLTTEITETEDARAVIQDDENTAKSIQNDCTTIDRYNAEIKDSQRKISDATAKLSASGSDKTLQEVQNEREEIQDKLETLNNNLERKQKKVQQHSENVHMLKSQINEYRGEKLRIETELQNRVRLEEHKEKLETDSALLQAELDDAHMLSGPLQAEIEDTVQRKETVTASKERQWEEDRTAYSAGKDKRGAISTLHSAVNTYTEAGKDALLAQKHDEIDRLEKKAASVVEERERLTAKQEAIRQQLDQQKTRERELDDNLKLRRKEESIRALNERLRQKQDELGGLDVTNLQADRETLVEQQEQLTAQKNRLSGQKAGVFDQMKELKRHLRDDQFKNAEAKYQAQLIDLRTTELANSDLDKYYRAMDRAIMSYHSTKMKEINKIIRELWRNTYKGHDIDTIEIQHGDDTKDESKVVSATSRKSYNYRVVMFKGDHTPLDMRNRCSAGQKVLASLIIRLALAETFCLNCGVLALDEPTTNLDRENIESLAYALVEIIKDRAGQKNFQLVVITHDEDFVELLGRSEYVDEFFKVRKDTAGCSQLLKAKVQDLHTR